MPFACLLEFVAAVIALGARASHDALFRLLGMGALVSAVIGVVLATRRTGISWAGIFFGDARACRERQHHASDQQLVLHLYHGRFLEGR
ncbi:MAG TPA: hypothetical protein VKE72_02345 [Methylocella sp.]|nr:hypothetical protein [Methylocella sp.]